MTELTDAQVTADLLEAKAVLDANGHSKASDIFALPQGAWTPSLIDAVNAAGMDMVIGIDGATSALQTGRVPVGVHAAQSAYAGASQPTLSSGVVSFPSRINLTNSSADVETYIDMLIETGGSGGCYTHDLTAGLATKFTAMCAYLRTKVDQGLIDVVTADQWRKGL